MSLVSDVTSIDDLREASGISNYWYFTGWVKDSGRWCTAMKKVKVDEGTGHAEVLGTTNKWGNSEDGKN